MSLTRHWLTSLPPLSEIKSRKLDIFIPSGTEEVVHPSSDPPKITAFTEVPQDTVNKIIRNSPTKSCLLDPWPTFVIKECSDILLPSIIKLATVGHKVPADDCKNCHHVSGLSFMSKWLNECP